MPANVVAHLSDLVARRDLAAGYEYCRANPGPLSHALASALTKANYERDMFNKTAMENSIADDCFRSETKMMVVVNYLNTFAVLAPMIGLLGTVSGMITSFSALTAARPKRPTWPRGSEKRSLQRVAACCWRFLRCFSISSFAVRFRQTWPTRISRFLTFMHQRRLLITSDL